MIIPSKKLVHYLDGLNFPVSILGEKSDDVLMRADRQTFLTLIAAGVVIGIGSWKRIKRLRMIVPQRAFKVKSQYRRLPVSEDSYTWETTRIPGGGITYEPHRQHCEAFSPTNRIDHK